MSATVPSLAAGAAVYYFLAKFWVQRVGKGGYTS